MPINYEITETLDQVVAPAGSTRLFHGTRLISAYGIINYGVDASRASSNGYDSSGSFWTVDVASPAVRYSQYSAPDDSGVSVVLGFDIYDEVLETCLRNGPDWLKHHFTHGFYEFCPLSHATLNSHMNNVTLTFIDP